MVRLSQDWKMGQVLVEMHGNNGSMDGDPPAAMRYTEARLSEISTYLLQDIDKNTVPFAWNFDDTEKEPTVLPASFPNLLVNGSTGISAGYATDIPTHNLGEVIDATVYMIDHPKATVDKLMDFLPGPDFPTGAIIQGKSEIKRAYETGKGKVVVRSKTAIEELKGGKKEIVVTEIPYELNKASLVKKIDDVRVNAKVAGIAEVRDESDRDGLRIAIELKKDADAELILNYLLKYTDLQVNYNFNMVAIDHATPQQVGIIPILSSYIQHKREIIRSRSIFDREKAEKRLHIVEGLIRVLSILDEVIALIRASDNKADARENLMASYDFSEAQAEAIVTLQLYRLTNTDVVTLQSEEAELKARILTLSAIINDEKTMFNVMKRELREVKKKFDQPRKSVLVDEVVTIEVEAASLIVKEETIVSVTRSGYVKRTTPRSFGASKLAEIGKREDDVLLFHQAALTTQHLLMFTTLGNVIYRPIHELDDVKWKDIGTHCSSLVNNFSQDEAILFAYILDDFETVTNQLLITTKFGLIKQVQLSDFKPWRTYRSKSLQFAKFKQADDVVIGLEFAQNLDIMLVTYNGYALRFPSTDVPLVGPKAAGVKAMNLKDADFIVASYFVSTDSFYVLTQRGSLKRVKFSDLPAKSRAGRGLQILRELKKAPHKVISSGTIKNRYGGDLFEEADQEMQVLQVISNTDTLFEINLPDLNVLERTSNGSFIFDETKELGVKSAKIK